MIIFVLPDFLCLLRLPVVFSMYLMVPRICLVVCRAFGEYITMLCYRALIVSQKFAVVAITISLSHDNGTGLPADDHDVDFSPFITQLL